MPTINLRRKGRMFPVEVPDDVQFFVFRRWQPPHLNLSNDEAAKRLLRLEAVIRDNATKHFAERIEAIIIAGILAEHEPAKLVRHRYPNGGVVAAVTRYAPFSNTYRVGVALCSPKDRFDNGTGRLLACLRLARYGVIFEPYDARALTAAREAVRDALSGSKPGWARKVRAELRGLDPDSEVREEE